jgi:hypothetical protein
MWVHTWDGLYLITQCERNNDRLEATVSESSGPWMGLHVVKVVEAVERV